MKKLGVFGLILFAFFITVSCTESQFTSTGCTGDECSSVGSLSYSWSQGSWSNCSRACGGGERTRTVQCLDQNKNPVPDDECGGTKPPERETCNSEPCTADYSWNIGNWGACSKSCGGGTKYRIVQCQSRTGEFVADKECPSPKPINQDVCNEDPCPDLYSWESGKWGKCTKTCDGGIWEREVYCKHSNGTKVPDDKCTGKSPATIGACNTQPCTYKYSWVTGNWGTCSKACGGGTQTRSLGCMRDDGIYVAHTLCPTPAPATSQPCNTDPCKPTCEPKTIYETVPATQSQADILLIIDDSGSMIKDSTKLANKLDSFVDQMTNSNIDWQMCVTSTDVDYYEGRPIDWQGTSAGHILKKNSGNLKTIFKETMKWIGAGFSDDEQGIKAINLAIKNNGSSNCFRDKAALAVILISDEDERSVGGDRDVAVLDADYKPLGTLNQPKSVLQTIKDNFSSGKRVVINSIIVKDKACRDAQRAEGSDARGYYGNRYKELSNLTNGGVESICASDYTFALQNFYSCVNRTIGVIALSCTPKDKPEIKVNGANYSSYTIQNGNELTFNPVVNGPATITGSYCCPK